jgi:hypothetical protein
MDEGHDINERALQLVVILNAAHEQGVVLRAFEVERELLLLHRHVVRPGSVGRRVRRWGLQLRRRRRGRPLHAQHELQRLPRDFLDLVKPYQLRGLAEETERELRSFA